MAEDRKSHWDNVYATRAATAVSWYEARPVESLALVSQAAVSPDDPIIDVGAGASTLVDELLGSGFRDLTVLEVSAQALGRLRERLGQRAASLQFLECDVTEFRPTRAYALWHDRAVFHFLAAADRRKYADTLRAALRPNGHAVIATFGPSGPERCSGLPTTRYDAAALARELGGALQLVESRLVLHHTPRGAAQQFLYCLLRNGADG